MKKLLITLIVLALAGLLGWQIYVRLQEQTKPQPSRPSQAAVAVEAVEVSTGPIRRLGLYTGSLKPSAQFVIAPRITGRLKRLLVNIGDPVKRDQVVVELIDQEYRLKVEQAEAAVAVARATLTGAEASYNLARQDFKRASSLGGKRIVTQSELDAKRAALDKSAAQKLVAQAELEAALTALKEARVHLSYTRIQASWRGGSDTRVVGERFVDEGSLLAANTPVATILQIDPIIAVINVIERDYPLMKIGRPVTVYADALPGRKFQGRVARLSPIMNESSRQALVELEIPNPDQSLKPGMFVRAEIEFDRHPTATIIPQTALVNRGGREGVFLIVPESKTVRFVALKTGLREGELVEVLEPALSGRVVTLGHHLLADGAPISLGGRGKAGQAKPKGQPKAEAKPQS